jgi:hypothetical protein
LSDEFEFEPIPGLPGQLPEGERLLWQGSPSAKSLARKLFHVGWIGTYFAVLIAWRVGAAAWEGTDMGEALGSASWLAAVGAISLAMIFGLASLMARTTIYSITSRRVVMRYGMALPLTINLPFKAIVSADIKHNRDGTGNIALQMNGDGRVAYLHLWPNARPWHIAQPQPLLRSLGDYQTAAEILRREFLAANPKLVSTPATVGAPAKAGTHDTRDTVPGAFGTAAA